MDICPILNDTYVSFAIHDENVLNVVCINLWRNDKNMYFLGNKYVVSKDCLQ